MKKYHPEPKQTQKPKPIVNKKPSIEYAFIDEDDDEIIVKKKVVCEIIDEE